MKLFIHSLLIFILLVLIAPQYTAAQTNLNPPDRTQNSNPRNTSNELQALEFESIEFDDLALEPLVVGQNPQGLPEFSVLENTPGALIVESYSDRGNFSAAANNPESTSVSNELNRWITGLVLKHMPHEYEQDKKWGKQAKRWAGVKLRRDSQDGKLETKGRYKMVNHGTWQKYGAKLVDPENQFAVLLNDVARTRDGKTAFEVDFAARLNIHARQAKWVKGVQLYSFSARGQAKIRLAVRCELGIGMDFGNFPPDLVFSPHITDAKITIEEFKLDRVSKVGGEVAQQLGRHARKEMESRIHEKEQKLVKKLNKEIDENRDKLRLSIAEAIRLKWYGQTHDFLPPEVQNALASHGPTIKQTDPAEPVTGATSVNKKSNENRLNSRRKDRR